MHSTLLTTTGGFGGTTVCGGGGTGCLRAGGEVATGGGGGGGDGCASGCGGVGGGAGAGEAATGGGGFGAGGVAATGGGGVVSFAGNFPSLLPRMSDRSIGVGEGNIPPEVCWGEGLASVALEVGVCANRSRPGVGTPVRKNLIGEGVGGVRSFVRLLVISAQGGGVVSPFVGGGSTVGEVVTVGVRSGACTGAGGGVDGPFVEGGSLVGGGGDGRRLHGGRRGRRRSPFGAWLSLFLLRSVGVLWILPCSGRSHCHVRSRRERRSR